jgi:hypothetical protein
MFKFRFGAVASFKAVRHSVMLSSKPEIPLPPIQVLLIEEVHTVAKKLLIRTLLASALFLPVATWACDAAGPSTHIGTVQSVDASSKTFTIIDAQTRMPIKFVASNEIIEGLKDAKGSVMVNYEEMESTDGLKAVGVTF